MLDLNPQSPAQAATQSVEQQSAAAPSVAIAPGQPEVPMAGAPSPAATPPVHPLVAGTASTSLVALNNAPPKPGNFARSVLTGLLTTMSKLGGGAEKVMAGLSQPGGGIDTLGIMAGSKPGQEYNDIQAAKAARQQAAQNQQEFVMRQHEGHVRVAVLEKQLQGATDEQRRAAETDGQAQVQKFADNGGVPTASGISASEIGKYFGMKDKNGNPLTIVRTGSSITGTDPTTGEPISSPTYSVLDSSLVKNVPITPEESDRLQKDGLLAPGATIVSMPLSQQNALLGKARVIETAQAKLQDEQKKLDIDVAKGEASKQTAAAYEFLGTLQAQFPKASSLDLYHILGQETQQVDPKTGQPTPTAVKARQMMPSVLQAYGGPKGIATMEDAQSKAEIAAHKAAQGGKLTPEQTEVKKESDRLASARMSNLNAWNRAKDEANAADAAVKGVNPHAKNYAALQTAKLRADAKAASAQANFKAANTDYYTHRSTQYRAAFPQSAPAPSQSSGGRTAPAQATPGGLQPGQSILYDPQGNPHAVETKLVPQYLASPQYKGWASTPPSPAPVKK